MVSLMINSTKLGGVSFIIKKLEEKSDETIVTFYFNLKDFF